METTLTAAHETRAETLVEWIRRLQHSHDHGVNASACGTPKKSLNIHLLGADHREGNTGHETFEVFKSFSHKLHLTRFSKNCSSSDESNSKTCQVEASYFVGDFEAYFADKTLYCEPDLVVCFNAGIWGYDQWLPAIRLVLNEVRVPLLVTSYNENEAGDDEDVLDELMPSRWLWRPEKNPRGANTPRATNNKDGSVLKENDYWMCLSGRP
ncbi:hypothetical protein BBJ29_007656 [Phytophthora kernoviae]|uniref:Mitochondrial splicing suppressor 51-like C-terminal domain-containing protein n=1 Tax=Phytophthora kernoviae TaxID=325452 RepID=A0A3F2S2W6_9STRA|nr:hypothetical protein BBJ29_007656 [Phytophthora kernoviae]RLN69256.1 hypothetical protein BBP00_00000499 [Phytophthora kernoviae]